MFVKDIEISESLTVHAYFENIVPGLSRMLLDYNAFIAGGSVLSILKGLDVNDVDIYVHPKDGVDLVKSLMRIDNSCGVTYGGGATYGKGFMKLNHILVRYCLKLNGVDIDVMFVDPFISIPTVIQHFDLSCSMFSFNGIKLEAQLPIATHALMQAPRYYLMPWYKGFVIDGNPTTRHRIKKYGHRLGTSVQLEVPPGEIVPQPLPKMHLPHFLVSFLREASFDVVGILDDVLPDVIDNLDSQHDPDTQFRIFTAIAARTPLSLSNVGYLRYVYTFDGNPIPG